MTTRLRDVLNDIAGDVTPVDLTAAVQSRTRRIRWGRRAAAGGAALTVAATVGLVTVVLPTWEDGGRVVDVPQTSPSVAPLVEPIDLDTAVAGTLSSAVSVFVVDRDDLGVVPVAVDADGEAVVLDVEVPDQVEALRLSADGTRVFMLGSTQVTVADLTTGEVAYTTSRAQKQPFATSIDGTTLYTFAPHEGAAPQAPEAPIWRLELIDVTTGEVTGTDYRTQRSNIDSTLWPAPDGTTVFVRYADSMRDQRTSRIDLVSATVTYAQDYTALPIERLVWSPDASVLLAEMSSSVRVLEPTTDIGNVVATISKPGTLVGFNGNETLVWWRSVADGVELQETDLLGGPVGDPTLVSVTGTVLQLAGAG